MRVEWCPRTVILALNAAIISSINWIRSTIESTIFPLQWESQLLSLETRATTANLEVKPLLPMQIGPLKSLSKVEELLLFARLFRVLGDRCYSGSLRDD
jgi:hypothetical protein